MPHRILAVLSLFLCFNNCLLHAQKLNLTWTPREDLNILLPSSVRLFETNGTLNDGSKIRAMYATIDLRDDNLKLRAVGSNGRRETTLDTYNRYAAILAINGGYFSSTKSESLLVSDGELIAPGPSNFTRAAFGLVNRKPQIVWPFTIDSKKSILHVNDPIELKKDLTPDLKTSNAWHPAQAVGGGPMLVKNGKIRDTSKEEGFGASHLLRHPRTAIGYLNDYTLLMMVVDGRQQSSSGVTITELAQLMFEVGCYEALNLDGGGSSAMVAADEVVNVPVDIPNGNRHSLRRNASALVLTETFPSEKKNIFLIDTDSKEYSEKGVWQNTNHVNFYGNTSSRQSSGNAVNKSIYRFSKIKADSFQLSAWWTVNEKNTKQATFILHRGNVVDSILVDQTRITSNGRWNVFGNFYLTPDDYMEVTSTSEGKLITDAVRLVSIGKVQHQPVRGDLRIAVISDLNSGLGSASYEWQVDSIIKRIPRAWKPDLVVCGGDMVAGMGVSDTATLSKMWSGFDDHIAGPLRKNKIPFAFTIGNHDGLRSYPIERAAISKYWSNTNHKTGLEFVDDSHFPHYYSFKSGNTFFISWDASSSAITEENLAWLAKEFERTDARTAKMRVVIGHLPIYSVAQERDSKGNVLDNGDELRKLLEKHDVNVYISGHQHAYYPGKRGKLALLNAGAAGSGPRRWLTTDLAPVNTVTIMDLFYSTDTIIYSTYDIKHKDARSMTLFDHHELPSSISGVNGFIIRNDIELAREAKGLFYLTTPEFNPSTSYGRVNVEVTNNKITFMGDFSVNNKLIKSPDAIGLYEGKFTQTGKFIFPFPVKSKDSHKGKFSGELDIIDGMREKLAVGEYYIMIKSQKGEYRAQLYPERNTRPSSPLITSHESKNIFGVRNTKALYTMAWTSSHDIDGDHVSYTYQLSDDSLFNKPVLEVPSIRGNSFKIPENRFYELLNNRDHRPTTFYHRVIVTDGFHVVQGKTSKIELIKSDEQPDDLIELDAGAYRFDGKIENAPGQGSGALWDNAGKLWLADYGGSLYVTKADGTRTSFSPLQSVTINNKSYSLKPINGIGLDLDGNILVGSNRFLIKIDAQTGSGIAAWEAPEGKRAITSPRANSKGEIYAMSLFAEDPNYALKQSTTSPGTFDLVRTINLPKRILARAFDMSEDGLTLFFPDPGTAMIQTYKSTDGITYQRNEDITSVIAGCNAIHVLNNKLFAAVRASGISEATLHMRDEKEKFMWTLPLSELDGAEARGIAVSPDENTIIICAWDKGGGFYRYKKITKD